MSNWSKSQIIAEATAQGLIITSKTKAQIARFVVCVISKAMTKPLPVAVAECWTKLFGR